MNLPKILSHPLLILLLGLAPLTGCQTNEATGRSQLSFLSWEDEVRLGSEAAPEFLEQGGGELPDQQILNYVRDLGNRLAAESEMPDIEWEFHVLDSQVINAFALPGGKVFMSRGLMEKMTNEAQLAGVLGHEIGHVTARHGNERMSQAMLAQGALLAVGVAGAVSDDEWMQVLGVGTAVGGQLFLLKYSRANETEADKLGVRYMTRVGYNPVGQIQVMEILKAASGGGGGPEWLSTHPAPETRITELEQLIRQEYPGYDSDPPTYVFREAEFQKNVLEPLSKLPPAEHGASAFIGPEQIEEVAGISWQQATHRRGCPCQGTSHHD
jgi:predicted Zn-dependent protease